MTYNLNGLQYAYNGLFKFSSLNVQPVARTEKHLPHNKRYGSYANIEKLKTLLPKQKKKILEEGREGLVASWNQKEETILWYVKANGGKY